MHVKTGKNCQDVVSGQSDQASVVFLNLVESLQLLSVASFPGNFRSSIKPDAFLDHFDQLTCSHGSWKPKWSLG